MKDIQFWHSRFLQQAQWTANVRQYLFRKSGINTAKTVLDVGCGTGVSLAGVRNEIAIGVDTDLERLLFAKKNSPNLFLSSSDAHHLPFLGNSISHSFCQFLLLWVDTPEKVLKEMLRVTKPGGKIFAIAEPDYGGRIDFPQKFEAVGIAQIEGLIKQGADPEMGRKIKKLFKESGLIDIELGIINGSWSSPPSKESFEIEWEVISSDVKNSRNEEEIIKLKEEDKNAWKAGIRVLYIPTFYAIGTKQD